MLPYTKTVWLTIYNNKNLRVRPDYIKMEPMVKIKCKTKENPIQHYQNGACIDLQLCIPYQIINTCYSSGFTYCVFKYKNSTYSGFIFGHNKMQDGTYILRLDPIISR